MAMVCEHRPHCNQSEVCTSMLRLLEKIDHKYRQSTVHTMWPNLHTPAQLAE